MTTVSVVTAQPGTPTASNGDHASGFTHDYKGSHLLGYSKAEWRNVFPTGG